MDRIIDLKNYLPLVYTECKTFQNLMQIETGEIKALWENETRVLNDQFIETIGEQAVLRWERILNILPKASDCLEERKFRILVNINQSDSFTWNRLKEVLGLLCGKNGFKLQLNPQQYTLFVGVELAARKNFDEVSKLLYQIAPANLVILLSLLYNQHETVANNLHETLRTQTHDEIRTEVA